MNGGAHANVRDNQGCIPLHLAAWNGNVDICKALLTGLVASDVNIQVCVGMSTCGLLVLGLHLHFRSGVINMQVD